MTQTTGHGEKLSRKQEQAISALLGMPTIEKAAQETGVAEKTLRVWLKKPGFKKAYWKARQVIVDQAIGSLQKSCEAAAKTLLDIASDTEKPPTSRVSASKAIFDLVFRGSELYELTERIESLEQVIEKMIRENRL